MKFWMAAVLMVVSVYHQAEQAALVYLLDLDSSLDWMTWWGMQAVLYGVVAE